MKKINKKTLTNKQLRRLFKRAKDFAQKCNQGDTIMCPCGCMRLFAKKTKKSIFFEQKNNQCKNNYYSRIRSESNYDFDSQKTDKELVNYLEFEKIFNVDEDDDSLMFFNMLKALAVIYVTS